VISIKYGDVMDWLGVVDHVRAQVARSGEALLPWSTIEQAAKTIPGTAKSAQAATRPGEDHSPMRMLMHLAEHEGNLEFTIDFSSKLVHLKKPINPSPEMR
jgi:hypothetical protein